jgi:hypothetical protein
MAAQLVGITWVTRDVWCDCLYKMIQKGFDSPIYVLSFITELFTLNRCLEYLAELQKSCRITIQVPPVGMVCHVFEMSLRKVSVKCAKLVGTTNMEPNLNDVIYIFCSLKAIIPNHFEES